MKKPTHGQSLYYATDKNIFDALNQHRVGAETVFQLFLRRNTLVSKKTLRETLAYNFSRLTHDYYDHQTIAARLGITTRREKLTSLEVGGLSDSDNLRAVVDLLKSELELTGDVVTVDKNGENLTLRVQFSEIDYRRNEFNQVQVKDGVIELEKTATGYNIRNTQNDYINNVRDNLLCKVEKTSAPLEKSAISLISITAPKVRSKFFYDLSASLPGYVRRDVTDVYVFKASPPQEEEDSEQSEDAGTHVERVFLRGRGVSRSEVLNDLLEQEDYYIVKMGWTVTEQHGAGNVYDLEVSFADLRNCTGFAYIVAGVFPLEQGRISSRRRTPTKDEINVISKVIEERARQLIKQLTVSESK